ncbi:hypothetical protein EMIHUDRAFT_453682 [Emiliania huxleyi CCMP1516]|uniref:GH18 domain-containing protein n=2 Tax=Emiliania huxleyi TaxID=2903 RepID=A0A0D3I1G6_EMIH1|nr:hypothetical protein EMIHUDRAFT_453682 [Emiliania huxleyi CCMP1516]EOD05101.1 hypothetical protein EMIHUDRAFT_453682 [Emiliania huxleyi CCMP1516]|eukprot:XP_005757530.1 hypothetical protein EMIHUDRAFT_453682 [Emiliania huxleyi CCMP1516]
MLLDTKLASLLAILSAVTATPQCPPAGWETCSSAWPPPADGYCCSAAGWLGNTAAHCSNINALDECCSLNDEGRLTCVTECEEPPAVCTGDAAIDAVLLESKIGCKIGLIDSNEIYKWSGFCDALRSFNDLESDRRLFLGEGDMSTALGLSNIAGLLAQAMWESGGEAPFTACDENDYPPSSPTASCTQRSDGELYHSLNDQPWACYVDPQMTMTAETWASWAPGPLKCEPGTGTEKCCWWGRGAIQTTGPNNYGLLQREVFSQVPSLSGIDLCTNPEAICQNDDAKWLGAIFYWANNVQGYGLEAEAATFDESLRKFVESGFNRAASVVAGADFASGTGGVVNNGYWGATPAENAGRLSNFDFIISDWGIYQYGNRIPFKPSDLHLDKITHVHYAFFDVTSGCAVASMDPYADFDVVYPEVGMTWSSPHKGNVGALRILRDEQYPDLHLAFSLGGWTKSKFFSGCAADADKRAALVASAVDLLTEHDFDGIDVDWEYPVCCGESDNQVDGNDWANYVLLLRELRAAMDERSPSKHKELTIAMGMNPRVSGVAPRAELGEVLDAINLMSYDYNGAWLPFLWLEDVAPSKLVLGLPAYGRGWLGANQEYAQAPGENGAGSPVSGTYEEGLVSYYDIKANYDGNPAWTKGWNAASKVPFYYRSSPASFVSFDDEQSIAIKAAYAKEKGFAGMMWWEASDDKDADLLSAANSALVLDLLRRAWRVELPRDCLGGSGRRRLAESAPAPWSSNARAAVAAPLALAAVAGLAVYGRRHRASQASNLADIESCAEEA